MHRRYDIDWIRVIAIGLLLIYHTAIAFQPWGRMIGFITTETPWTALWFPMAMLNVWRIPILFLVSGMGVYFALQNRNWLELLAERGRRIGVPLLVGYFVIVPIQVYVRRQYYNIPGGYMPHSSHLWFLLNILAYVVLLTPLFAYMKRKSESGWVLTVRRWMGTPWVLVAACAALILEVLLVNPYPYEYYVMNLHGFVLGFIAFFFGFCFVWSGDGFWKMIVRLRWIFPLTGLALFVVRTWQQAAMPAWLLPVETISWIVAVLAFGHKYLNRGGRALRYASQAAYPVYVLHMVFLFVGSTLFFRTALPMPVQFVFVLAFTILGCLGSYELIHRLTVLRVLFGLPTKSASGAIPNAVQKPD